jgi:hypothetical protein
MKTTNYTIQQLRQDLENPYAWPGGYPRFFITHDGEALSFKSAKENQPLIETAIAELSNDGWRVIACEINWEDSDLYCCDSGDLIEAAYN